jgi:queuine tRNA-ribosyltransferase
MPPLNEIALTGTSPAATGFELVSRDPWGSARAGLLQTPHGMVETPLFMPVGTQGSVKGISSGELKGSIGAGIVLGNTYHLYLRPGTGLLEETGGLHRFMRWDGPLLTDSGGYQVFSLADRRRIREVGVEFASHIDGSRHLFSPEESMRIQRSIGADFCMAFDECTPYPCDHRDARQSMELTHRWLDRSLKAWELSQPLYGFPQRLIPIVQGSTYPDLRLESARYIAERATHGCAIGGLSVGEPTEDMYRMTEEVTAILPESQFRYLMGVGTPANILESIARGVDLFDCVMPTRNARNGMLFTWQGIINLRNRKWRSDLTPLDPESSLAEDQLYSKAYVAHLLQCHEMLGARLATLHNLHFYMDLTRLARKQILAGDFSEWKSAIMPQLLQRL